MAAPGRAHRIAGVATLLALCVGFAAAETPAEWMAEHAPLHELGECLAPIRAVARGEATAGDTPPAATPQQTRAEADAGAVPQVRACLIRAATTHRVNITRALSRQRVEPDAARAIRQESDRRIEAVITAFERHAPSIEAATPATAATVARELDAELSGLLPATR